MGLGQSAFCFWICLLFGDICACLTIYIVENAQYMTEISYKYNIFLGIIKRKKGFLEKRGELTFL